MAFVYDEQKARVLGKTFDEDLTACYQLSLDEWSQRSLWRRILEAIARLFSPLL